MRQIILCVLFISFTSAVSAQTLMKVKPEGGYTNIRSGKGTNYQIVTKYKDGSDIYVGPNQNGWRPVYRNSNGGFVGFISASKVVPRTSNAAKPAQQQSANGKLIAKGTYTRTPAYVQDGNWFYNGVTGITTLTIYEKTLYEGNASYPFIHYENCLGVVCRRYGNNDDGYFLVSDDGKVRRTFSFSANYPMLGTVRSTTINFYDKGDTRAAYVNTVSPGVSTSSSAAQSGYSGRKEHVCGLCGGRGTVGTDEGVSNYGSSSKKWCADCGRYVYLNHYHKTCPSCNGRGQW